jgi:hypothetical protein
MFINEYIVYRLDIIWFILCVLDYIKKEA